MPLRGTRALAPVVLALLAWLTPGATAAPVGTVAESPVPSAEASPASIAAGPDGNLWFTEYKGEKIGRITPAGEITEFAIPTATARPEGIAAGPDGNIWFAERKGNKIARITPSGEIAEFPLLSAEAEPESIAAGPDGNMWFTEEKGNQIGRITPGGEVSEFPVPTSASEPMRIAAGAGGDLWFTEYAGESMGRITPAGEITQFPLPDTTGGPWGIAAGVEGDMWFTEFRGDRIGRITPTGEIAEFPLPNEKSFPEAIAAGPDGNIWFAEYKGNRIGRITPTGEIAEFPLPNAESAPAGLAAGPDGQMWFAETRTDTIGRIATGRAQALVSPPVVLGGSRAGVAQTCKPPEWSTWAAPAPSPSLYGFDGYSWLLEGSEVAQGASFTPTSAEIGKALSCTETVTYPVLDVTASSASAPVSVLSPPLKISGVRESSRLWREGRGLARISRKPAPPVGTAFSFSLSVPATVELKFSVLLAGHRAGGRCVPGALQPGRGRRCTTWRAAGLLRLSGRAGANRIGFQGRVSRSARLRPGGYALKIIARAEGQTASASLRFTILGRAGGAGAG